MVSSLPDQVKLHRRHAQVLPHWFANCKPKHAYNVKAGGDVKKAVAWLLRHPARMQPILGTTNLQRVKDASKAFAHTIAGWCTADNLWSAGGRRLSFGAAAHGR